MKAIIIATGQSNESSTKDITASSEMSPFFDRPFAQHVLEQMVRQGITDFEFVVCHQAHTIESYFGDGDRWGCNIRYHLVRDSEYPYEKLPLIAQNSDSEAYLLAHADCLPVIDDIVNNRAGDLTVYSHMEQQRKTTDWTGWALLSAEYITLMKPWISRDDLAEQMSQSENRVSVRHVLSVQSPSDLLSSQKVVLDSDAKALHILPENGEPNLHIGRNVQIRPGVKVNTPVYIGENSRIAEGCSIGPNVVIGENSLISRDCTIVNSAILPGSYVGEDLHLDMVVVNKNQLTNVMHNAATHITDPCILGDSTGFSLRPYLNRISASVLLLLTLPLMAVIGFILKLFRKAPVMYTNQMVRLPASEDMSRWRHFRQWSFLPREKQHYRASHFWQRLVLHQLPALYNVARGDIQWIGATPKTMEEILQHAELGNALYLKSYGGLITAAEILQAETDEEALLADGCFAVAEKFELI